jgi:hypothetical protein
LLSKERGKGLKKVKKQGTGGQTALKLRLARQDGVCIDKTKDKSKEAIAFVL